MTKEQLIYNKILKDILNLNLDKTVLTPNDLKVETLTERAIAKVANLTWVGDENLPYDFKEDNSDAKTSSVAASITYYGTITSTESKEGALRCVITNEFSPNEIDYFYIPVDMVRDLETCPGGKKNQAKKCIKYTYLKDKDTYGKLEPFRCKNFKEMCNKNG